MPQPITFTSPLPDTDLLFESMSFTDGLSRLGEMQLTLASPRSDIEPKDLLGQPVSVKVVQRDESVRWFHGYVARFGAGQKLARPDGFHHSYQATVRPWLWFLTRTADCRVFQDMTVPEIVKKVFDDHPIAKFKLSTFREYRKWTYCVQYRESDFDFVARLLEHEGIYWYFTHADGEHTLNLVDSASSHDAVEGCDLLPFFANGANLPPDVDYVAEFQQTQTVQAGQVVLRSYDFERPTASLEVTAKKKRSYDLSEAEVFDWQGDYVVKADGQQWAENRIEELQSAHEQIRGLAFAHGVTTGHLLTLEKHPHEVLNQKYLITGTTIHATAPVESGDESSNYRCGFLAIPATQDFRPPRSIRKPFVQGPQTAVVVGPAGEEIHTDKYGRVKVQFFWDRRGEQNENSSCWLRVSHPWAGKNFGVIHTPRIGQEVIVDFIEGDPDQPIVTGRVYNADQMPPWELPANATQSGILTRSTPGGSYDNANMLRFEDKKGAEQVALHAERNLDTSVEADETHTVGHDRTKTIGNDETNEIKANRKKKVGANEDTEIGANRTEKVGGDETITISGSRTEDVGASETVTIGASRSHAIGADESLTVGAGQTINIGAARTDTVGAAMTQTIGGSLTQTVAGGINIVTPGAMTVAATGGVTFLAPGGTKFVDFQFAKLGGFSTETYGMKADAFTFKGETTAIAVTGRGVNLQKVGIDNAKANAMMMKAGIKMAKCDAAYLNKAGVGVIKASIWLMN